MIRVPSLSDFLIISSVIGIAISYAELYLFHIIYCVVILFSIKHLIYNNYKIDLNFFSRKYIYFFLLFFGWYLLSIFWSINKFYTLQYLFYIFCGIGIVFTIIIKVNTKKNLVKVVRLMGIIFSFEIFFSLLESLTSFRLPISPFSNIVTFFGRNKSLQPTLDAFALPSMIQSPTGFHWNPNDLAIAMILLVPFFLFYNREKIKWIAILSICIIIIMTSSRTVLLSLGILFIIYFLFYKKKLTTIILVLLLSTFFFNQLQNMKESENPQISDIANIASSIQDIINNDLLIGESLSIRRELATNGINAFIKTYGLGVGGGGSIAVQENVGGVDGRITSMHNFWLEILVDSGLVFTMTFFLWYILLTKDLYKIGIESKSSYLRYLGKSISLSMIIFIPAAISASSVIYFFPMWLLFGIALATLEVSSKTTSQVPELFSEQHLSI
jgi:teichuronic acid biosynthesis protein TuaE